MKLVKPEDWYSITGNDLSSYNGDKVTSHYSLQNLLAELHPDFEFQPWMFKQVPYGFWDSSANRKKYLNWLGQKLNFRNLDDWYGLSYEILSANHGAGLAKDRTLVKIVGELFFYGSDSPMEI